MSMFIRRNMSSNVSYQQLKEYNLFKQLTKVNDVMILKEILPMVVAKVSLDIDKQMHIKHNVIYMPQEQYETAIQGQNIEQLLKTRHQQIYKMKFFMIETKIYNILKYVFYKQINCMENMKNFQKLNFFYRSSLDQIPFGSYIYRKDDDITHIYYLVKGEIHISKSIDQKQINITTMHEGTFFGIYQFDQKKTKRILNACSSSNNTIVVSINLDLLTQLFGKDQNQVLNKLLSLNSQLNKINHYTDKSSFNQKTKIKKINFIKAYDFHKRLMKFTEQRKNFKNDPVFEKYVENKSLLFKIKDSNDFFPRQDKEISKNFANFHKNQSATKYCNRLNQHRMLNMTSFTKNSKQNMSQVIKKQRTSRQSDLLSSRLRKKFNQFKKQCSKTSFDPINTSRKSEIIQVKSQI